MKNDEKTEELNIEEGLDKLENIVEELEDQSLDLDKSVKLFQEGVELADKLKEKLNEAEVEIKKVIEKSDGSFDIENFEI